jgi:NCS1 family nucleobase:cation symporter-1
MSMEYASEGPKYGKQVLKVEPYGVEAVAAVERHGKARSQFTLWLGSNLTIADFALGFLPITLGLPWGWVIASVLIGNVLGALVLAASAVMGPSYGLPQLMIGKFSFGRAGGYLPALFNYVSTIGWFTVNNILGAFGLRVLFPGLAFWQGAIILVVVQGLLAVYGHNLIHSYERIMSVVLGVLFFVASIIALQHHQVLAAYHPVHTHVWPMFAIMVAAAFSYIGSWGPYASDYSRYLRPDTPQKQILIYAFLGAFIASAWLELVGAAVAVIAGPQHPDPIASLHTVMGGFGTLAVIAIILGGTAADALNLYSNALSAGAFDIRLPRWALAVIASSIGLLLSLLGSGQFEQNFENFLLLLGYWITPWIGVLFTDFYVFRAYGRVAEDRRNRQAVYWPGILSFFIGIIVALPFMNGPFPFTKGYIAKQLGGSDLSFYVGFLAAAVSYWLIVRARRHTRSGIRGE